MLNGDAEVLGILMASSGVGALVAVMVIVPLAQARKRSGVVMLAALFWLAFWLTIFAHSHGIGLSVASLFMVSLAAPTVPTMAMGLVQVMSPPDMRGRLISLFTVIGWAIQPLAALWIGQAAQLMGVETAIQINAIFLATGSALMLALRPTIMHHEYGSSSPVQPMLNKDSTGGPKDISDRIPEHANADEVGVS